MKSLTNMSYEEFGKLRFLDFFQKNEHYVEENEGGLESGIGFACFQGYGFFTAFISPLDSGSQTAEIALDFSNGCPEPEGKALLDYLGLGLRKGMTYPEVINVLGMPKEETKSFLLFVLGRQWLYYVACYFYPTAGLVKVSICRKDLADKPADDMAYA